MASYSAITFIVLQAFAVCAFCYPSMQMGSTCGYESCNQEKPGMINVHLVPHTHDDVGWIITVDEYYYKQVQWILDGAIAELMADPNKRFIYVEQAFFTRWYDEQDEETQSNVKMLVNQGRLEFILGGWSMNDEAATHYTAIIDNHKLGFEFLRQTFGDCARPKIGWQIDPFGHSREQASLFAQFGFDGLFFGRLDYQDKNTRLENKTMEFVWEASPNNLGKKSNLMTCVLFNHYMPPGNYWWDVRHLSRGYPVQFFRDNKKLHDYNVKEMVDGFITEVNRQAVHYRTKHLIMTMGSDFNYVQAHMFFKEMDKLIKYVNARQSEGSKINLLYSTPSCYLKQLNNDGLTWTTKQDDFFPYADRAHTFWTGYFTSRAALKFYVRTVNSYFQTVKQMAALAGAAQNETIQNAVKHLAEVVGVAQHHDAVTGTSKQAVAYDYAQRLTEGVNSGKTAVQFYYDVLMPIRPGPAPEQILCDQLNISICSVSETADKFQVTLYNPLARAVKYVTRVPVGEKLYTVYKPDGKTKVPTDINPISKETDRLRPSTSRKARSELVFEAELPAVGYATYFVEATSGTDFESKKPEPSNSLVLKGKYVSVTLDGTGRMVSMSSSEANAEVPLEQNFSYYSAHGGDCHHGPDKQPSGAYIFRPANNSEVKIKMTHSTVVYKGSVVQEARQHFNDWISQVIRVYEDRPYVEVEWTVGPIPIDDEVGKEIVTHYNINDWGNEGVFYTDSNGREVLERKLNYRPTWKLNQTEPIAGNYFPINAFISSKSERKGLQFTVLTDRSQGGSSLHDGDVEIMLHRRLLYDDCKGVGEPLNETGSHDQGLVVRGRHYLLLSKISEAASHYRPLAQEVFLQPQVTFSAEQFTPAEFITRFDTQRTGFHSEMPANVHLLTLEAMAGTPPVTPAQGGTPFLIRLEHFYEAGEDASLSKPVTFDLEKMFYYYQILGVHELALGANILASDVNRLNWKTENSTHVEKDQTLRFKPQSSKDTVFTLGPMEIITLQVDILTG